MAHFLAQGEQVRKLGIGDAVKHRGLGRAGRTVAALLAVLVHIENGPLPIGARLRGQPWFLPRILEVCGPEGGRRLLRQRPLIILAHDGKGSLPHHQNALDTRPNLAPLQHNLVADAGVRQLDLAAPRITHNRIDQHLRRDGDLPAAPRGRLPEQLQRLAPHLLDRLGHIPGSQL